MNWIISANSKLYNHASSFAHYGSIDWRQGNSKFALGDIIYIYCTAPIQRVRYKCKVMKLDMDFTQIRDDKEYWLDSSEYEKSLSGKFFNLQLLEEVDSEKLSLQLMLENGLNAAPQGPVKLIEQLENYIATIFGTANDEYFPDVLDSTMEIYEGLKKQVSVNKYERSSIARAKCIEAHGVSCKVCSFDFQSVYGELGKEFIHVHHITPIHLIGKNYKIDYVNDLVPVCPNCHAMLHKKVKGEFCTVLDLVELVKSRRNTTH